MKETKLSAVEYNKRIADILHLLKISEGEVMGTRALATKLVDNYGWAVSPSTAREFLKNWLSELEAQKLIRSEKTSLYIRYKVLKKGLDMIPHAGV